MKLGMFLMPLHPPERPIIDVHRWNLEVIQQADRLGYSEAWVGEHFTVPWEPVPAPDLVLAQALVETEQIMLAAGAHLLPYHHPAELACRVAYLDHMAQGRLMLGIGAGSIPTDSILFDTDVVGGQNRDMLWESFEIMTRLWTEDEPFEYQGKYWTVNRPGPMGNLGAFHMKPFQDPYPRIGVAGLTPGSETLKSCGERGFMPLSLYMNKAYLNSHWEAVEEGARRSGRTPDRADWRVSRDIFVAETDEEARKWVLESHMGRAYKEYSLPLINAIPGLIDLFKHDPSVDDSEVTVDYLIDTGNMFVGSVETVVERIESLQDQTGGFGTLMQLSYDYSEDPGPWYQSMELLANEVMPRVEHLGATARSVA